MSEALATTEKIVKADTRGRMRTTPERREYLLAEFERSAMTGRKFAEWAGISYSTFGNWWRARQKLRRTDLPAPGADITTSPRWLEAVVAGAPQKPDEGLNSGPLIAHGPGGVRLELSDERQIKLAAQLLRELGRSEGC